MNNALVNDITPDEVQFETSFDSRSSRLMLDLTTVPGVISKASQEFHKGRVIEAGDLLSEHKEEIEKAVDKYNCTHMFFLAYLYSSISDYESAEKWYKRAAAYNPKDYRFWAIYSTLYFRMGRKEEGFNIIQKKLDEVNGKRHLMSVNLLYLHYDHEISRENLFEAHKEWGKLVSESVKPKDIEFTLKRSGKIRVGYISPDFKKHPVMSFFMPFLAHHNRQEFEVYGYGNVIKPDDVTEQASRGFDVYRDVYGKKDEEVAEMIINDQVDILVDLAGHTDSTRIDVFAYKPAPIQVTYLGYPNTSGLETVDYRITDAIAETEDCRKYHVEQPVFIPDGFLCYQPYEDVPQVEPLAALNNGYITFGSFNNISKLNPYIISLWSRILDLVEGSKFLLKIAGGQNEVIQRAFLDMFESNGISSDRILFSDRLPDKEHYRFYKNIDIALDTYPYNGTTTTCEAMWMGAPVVSLAGEHHMSRVGASLLTKVGLEYFATKTEDEYIAKASALAMNIESLTKIRSSMRYRMRNGGLCDGKRFVLQVEKAYEQMVKNWIEEHS